MTYRSGPSSGGLIPPEDGGGMGSLRVPLFPLPSVVLFPKAVLPLHIFEERYKTMTADALGGDGQIAMALLRPGWEKDYYCCPAIEPVVCVGKILTHERLSDGRYNFLLQGMLRARVVRELSVERDGKQADRAYRIAVLQPLEESVTDTQAVEAGREAVRTAFSETPLAGTPLGERFLDLLQTSASTGDLIDLMAFNFIDDVATKQKMLAETDVLRRLALMQEALSIYTSPMSQATKARRFNRPSLN